MPTEGITTPVAQVYVLIVNTVYPSRAFLYSHQLLLCSGWIDPAGKKLPVLVGFRSLLEEWAFGSLWTHSFIMFLGAMQLGGASAYMRIKSADLGSIAKWWNFFKWSLNLSFLRNCRWQIEQTSGVETRCTVALCRRRSDLRVKKPPHLGNSQTRLPW